jgi:ATP-binding cassette subfamily B protein
LHKKNNPAVIPIPDPGSLFKQIHWLWNNIGRWKPLFCFGLFLSALTSAMFTINPHLSQELIDEVVTPKNPAPLLPILGEMLLVTIGVQGLRYLMVICMEYSSTMTMTTIREKMFDKVQCQDFKFFQHLKAGNMMNRMTSDLDMMRHSVAWISYQFTDCVCMFLAGVIFLFSLNWELALCMTCVLPFILLVSRLYVGKIRPRQLLLRQKLTNLSISVTENIDGNRVVKAFAREPYEQEHFEALNSDYQKTSVENAVISAHYTPILQAFSNILTIMTLLVGGIFMIRGKMTAGEYMAFSSLTWLLANPFQMLGNLLADLQRFHAAANMIMEIEESKPSIVDKPGAVAIPSRPLGGIEFKNVTLEIEGQKILDDISFKVSPGETLGILGATGSGKTSLVDMLLRFYEPTSGQVLLDGVDIQHYTMSSLRQHIGMAMQEVFLFSDTIDGNIAYGNPEMSDEDIKKAAFQSNSDDFIKHLDQKYDTIVGERGVGLSGGQKQRIALARALAIHPSVLILDDTTSAVDSETEEFIRGQLNTLDEGTGRPPCTKIIIAARITSFQGASQILVMQNGKITERGTHEELVKNENGFYHYIYDLQIGQGKRGLEIN